MKRLGACVMVVAFLIVIVPSEAGAVAKSCTAALKAADAMRGDFVAFTAIEQDYSGKVGAALTGNPPTVVGVTAMLTQYTDATRTATGLINELNVLSGRHKADYDKAAKACRKS